MKKLEMIAACLAIAGLVFKLSFMPMAGVLLTLGLGGLATIYFINSPQSKFVSSGLFFSNEKDSGLDPIIKFGIGLYAWSLSLLCVGILFSIQFWPSARFFLVLGLISIAFSYVVSLNKLRISNADIFPLVIRRLIVYGAIGSCLFILKPITLFEVFHRDNPALVEAVKKSWADPHNPELKKAVEEARAK